MSEKFIPPTEIQTLSSREIQRIAEYLMFLRDYRRHKDDRQTAASILETADEIDINNARLIGCDDIVMRLKRNALALCNLQDMVSSCIDSMQSEIRSIIEAQNDEHDRHLAHVEQLHENWRVQRRAETAKVRRLKAK